MSTVTSEKVIAKSDAKKCAKCENPIRGEMIDAFDKTYCKDCFTCSNCNCPITSYFVTDNKPVCKNCYDNKNATDCHKCKKPIIGQKLTDNTNHNYHLDCFVCNQCNCKIDGGYFIRSELPYCGKCNEQLKAATAAQNNKEVGTCFQCKKPIISSTPMVVVKPEEKYHKQCLKCSKCKNELPSQFQVIDNITSKSYACMDCN